MPTVRLSDAVIPEVFDSYQAVNTAELDTFYQSGIVVHSNLFDSYANQGGSKVTIPAWGDLDLEEEPNYGNDDPAQLATPKKIGSLEWDVRKAFLNQGWSTMDLVQELAGSNPMRRIRARVDKYWLGQWQRRLIASSLGLMNANIAQDGGDMVYNIATEDGDNATDANLFSRKALTGAIFTMGDRWKDTRAIAVHSMVMKRMVDSDDIITVRPSDGSDEVHYYLDRRVIVDDMLPVIPGGTSGFKYVSILFGGAMFGYGNGTPNLPTEVARVAAAGNGAGQETLWTRKTWILHPKGYSFKSADITPQPNGAVPASATLADLQKAANWERVVERKLVPMSFLITNG
ncbi:putative capsid protein [Achromobacter phage vB_AxyS_19-32_Axy16]|nr:putative capsid protein [Achromobacter phage vB_AxyS_19-32_Axy16]